MNSVSKVAHIRYLREPNRKILDIFEIVFDLCDFMVRKQFLFFGPILDQQLLGSRQFWVGIWQNCESRVSEPCQLSELVGSHGQGPQDVSQ